MFTPGDRHRVSACFSVETDGTRVAVTPDSRRPLSNPSSRVRSRQSVSPPMRQSINDFIQWLRRAITAPRAELDRWQQTSRFLYDFGRHGWRHLSEDNAPQMAAALAFRTLFGLLPVLVVVMITAKAFLGDQLPKVVQWFVDAMGANELTISAARDTGTGEAGEAIPLGQWLESMVAQATEINLSALGWVGAGILLYAAIGLMVTIEGAFNEIYRATSGRSWLRRIPLYWFVLTVGPLLLALTPYLDAQFAEAVSGLKAWAIPFGVVKFMGNVAALWFFMTALYMWVPNARVALRPAMIGGLVAAILIEVGKRFLGIYLQNAFSLNTLYGSLGLLPLFMFWVYLMWMVVLFGLEVSAMIQFLRGRQLEEMDRSRSQRAVVDPAAVVTLMGAVATRFARGETSTDGEIADATGLPEAAVERMVNRLTDRGYLQRVANDDAVILGRPAETIDAAELMRIGFELADDGVTRRRSGLLTRMRVAQTDLAAGLTLATAGSAAEGDAGASTDGGVA